jgi:isoquinoline 1-oxidoreductase subunit alpha
MCCGRSRGHRIPCKAQELTGEIMSLTLSINQRAVQVEAAADTPLLWVLRDELGLTGTKFGCGMGLCGACTVHVAGQPVRSCVAPVAALQGKGVVTIEGIEHDPIGRAVQSAWLALGVPQCGYCQAGQIMSAVALLRDRPQPSDADIDAAMVGNICRCGTYPRIRATIHQAAQQLREGT